MLMLVKSNLRIGRRVVEVFCDREDGIVTGLPGHLA